MYTGLLAMQLQLDALIVLKRWCEYVWLNIFSLLTPRAMKLHEWDADK